MSCMLLDIVMTCFSGYALTHNLTTGEMGHFDTPVVYLCQKGSTQEADVVVSFSGKYTNAPSCVGDNDPPTCACKPFGDYIIDIPEKP